MIYPAVFICFSNIFRGFTWFCRS